MVPANTVDLYVITVYIHVLIPNINKKISYSSNLLGIYFFRQTNQLQTFPMTV